ncbi:MAG: 30S ribosomal protein S12 methylthiotransferase RimO [Bacillota bacterium]|nr:30S ribosomal protein S12 methylthiotransferase RimO [Bacillota bacterium]MDI7250034.1 30S ribosomal protein S12 methylthiotransferase RimO [Bacillota bacterium]
MGPRACIVSLGCAKNLVDSESMAALLEGAGFALVTEPGRADAVVVNTCGFIAPAREESLSVIRDLCRRVRGVLVAVGCLAQRSPAELLAQGADAVVGTGELERLPQVLRACLQGSPPGRTAWVGRPEVPLGLPRRLSTGPTAYLKIAEGCDRRCTFCIIPRLRGRYRSRPVEDLVREARDLVGQGARELVLVAEDTSRYGLDLYGRPALPRLLEELAGVDGVAWIRVLYAYPSGFPMEATRLMSPGGRVVPYLDLPLQHVSDRVLARMGRPYRGTQVRRLLDHLRETVPGMVLRSTFLVGFPGESEEDFGQLIRFLEEYRLERAGFFPFYPEPEAPAAAFPDQVPEGIKQQRLRQAEATQQAITARANRRLLGEEVRVLVEARSRARRLRGTPGGAVPGGAAGPAGPAGPEGRGDALPVAAGRWWGQAPEVDGQVHVLGASEGPGTFIRARVFKVRGCDLIAVGSDRGEGAGIAAAGAAACEGADRD